MGKAQLSAESCKLGIMTYGQKLSNENSFKARTFLQSDYYHLVFPSVQLGVDNITHWRLKGTQDISYFASSVGGAATGLGFDYLIIDDPLRDIEEASNRDHTQKLYDWFNSVARTRIEAGGNIIILATRWSDHDLTGRLMKEGGWDILTVPAINESGESLWPERYPVEDFLELRSKNPRIFECLFQQNPLPIEGKLIKKSYLKYGRVPGKITHRFITWDCASTISKTSDWSVGIEFEVDEYLNIGVVDFIRVKEEFPQLLKTIKSWGSAPTVYIEKAAAGIQVLQSLPSVYNRRSFLERKVTVSKSARLEAMTPQFEAGKIFLAEEYLELEKELLQFPDGAHDDCVDALTLSQYCIIRTTGSTSVKRDEILSNSSYAGLF